MVSVSFLLRRHDFYSLQRLLSLQTAEEVQGRLHLNSDIYLNFYGNLFSIKGFFLKFSIYQSLHLGSTPPLCSYISP